MVPKGNFEGGLSLDVEYTGRFEADHDFGAAYQEVPLGREIDYGLDSRLAELHASKEAHTQLAHYVCLNLFLHPLNLLLRHILVLLHAIAHVGVFSFHWHVLLQECLDLIELPLQLGSRGTFLLDRRRQVLTAPVVGAQQKVGSIHLLARVFM